MSIKRLSRGLGAAAALVLLIAAAGSAQPVDHRTYFTFSGPVELPGVALAPGKYLFRIANPESSGNVVQVLSADGTKSYATFFALPVLRTQPSPDPSVQFMETPTGTPPAIRAWWDPDAVLGREFLYPKEQARRLAKTSSEPVLTTKAETTTAQQTGTGDLVRIGSNGQETAVDRHSKPAASSSTGASQQGENAPSSVKVPSDCGAFKGCK
jgi:hypothetical protein